jgi:hypothetical protein
MRSNKSSVDDALTGSQKQVLDQLGQWISSEMGQGAETYGGQLTPNQSALQSRGFGMLEGGGLGSEAEGVISQLLSGQSAYEVDPAAREAVYGAQTARSTRDWENNIIPEIMERYNAQGLGRSGGIEAALGQSGMELAMRNREFGSGLEYKDEMARRAGLESAAGRQVAGTGAYMGNLQSMLGAGEMQRGIEGEQLAEGYQQWSAGQAYNNPVMGFLNQLLGTQATTTTEGGWGFLS